MMARSHAQSTDGFTLVELLVVLALTGLLTLSLYQAFHIGSRAANRANPDADAATQFALMQDFIDREIAAAVPLPVPSDSTDAIQFDGEPQAISFIGLPPAFLGLGGFHLLHLQLIDGRIEVSWEPLARGPAAAQPGASRPSILMDGVNTITFAYFGVPAVGEPPNWIERWADRPDLPQLVRLRIILADGTPSPDMIVAPRLAESQPNDR
jgi:general secretion pathway protein J